MEDAATAEIARAQIWQWLRHPKAELVGRHRLTETDVRAWLDLEQERACGEVGCSEERKFPQARMILEDLIYDNHFREFLTLSAYPQLV
jgi:malate synthase